jgi:hypothetical protein
VGVLQATAMGLSIYRRLGFREVCEYRCYAQRYAQSTRAG